jgi:Protein of unknown function DUF262
VTTDAAAEPQVRELTDDSGALDVEFEDQGVTADDSIERPWNPKDIRVETKNFSLRNVVDFIDEESLDLAPDFQRLRVWSSVQKSQLIESVLLQIPLPAFYFAEDETGLLRVVDGVQRLSTIHDFVRGGTMRLRGLEYIHDVEGHTFAQLPPQWQRRLHNTQIVAHVIAPTTPQPVMYDIFRRINTGGTPLNSQEIRHCMSKPRSRAFLVRLTELPEFIEATGGGLPRGRKRMIDREVALRVVAFLIFGSEGFTDDTLDDFLWRATQQLDDPGTIGDDDLGDLEETVRRGLQLARLVFGEQAFRKWPRDATRNYPFNRALFDSWTACLADPDVRPLDEEDAARIREAARDAMTSDQNYVASITSSTGARRNVVTRFQVAQSIIWEAIT